MIILDYETRLQQCRTAVVPDNFDIVGWKARMVENDIMTPNLAKKVEVRYVAETDLKNIGRLLAEYSQVIWWYHWRLLWCDIASEMAKQ